MLNHFKNISCYEEFEMQCTLISISKIDVLKEIGYKIFRYYFFVSNDGIFNWFDLNGNHVENTNDLIDIGIFTYLAEYHIPKNISKCIIPDNIKHIGAWAFADCKSLKLITIPNNVTSINNKAFCYCTSLKEIIFKGRTLEQVKQMKNYPFGIKDKSIIKCEM